MPERGRLHPHPQGARARRRARAASCPRPPSPPTRRPRTARRPCAPATTTTCRSPWTPAVLVETVAALARRGRPARCRDAPSRPVYRGCRRRARPRRRRHRELRAAGTRAWGWAPASAWARGGGVRQGLLGRPGVGPMRPGRGGGSLAARRVDRAPGGRCRERSVARRAAGALGHRAGTAGARRRRRPASRAGGEPDGSRTRPARSVTMTRRRA